LGLLFLMGSYSHVKTKKKSTKKKSYCKHNSERCDFDGLMKRNNSLFVILFSRYDCIGIIGTKLKADL
jgi:hypothetical protein